MSRATPNLMAKVWLLICISTVSLGSSGSNACIICLPMPQATIADRLIDSNVVVFARENPAKPFSFRAVKLLKGDLDSDEIDLFVNSTTRRRLSKDQDLVVILVRDKMQTWRSLGVADKVFQQMVVRILASSVDWTGDGGVEKRCQFFVNLLGLKNRALFEQAYLELGRAPYPMIKQVARLIPKDKLRPMLEDREYIEWRPLAILMLASEAGGPVRRLVKTQFEDCSRFALTTNLAAWTTAYIELYGKNALEVVVENYLNNTNRSQEELQAVLIALSVHGREGRKDLRNQIVESYGKMLQHHPWSAGRIASDLTAWKRNDYQSEIQSLLKQTNPKLNSEDRRAIRCYLALD